MVISKKLKTSLVAPCGMNCRLCYVYQRDRKPCHGCHGEDIHKPKHCLNCKIKTCDHGRTGNRQFCFTCDQYPCRYLKQFDKRYQKKYGVSPIENLNVIEKSGIRDFVRREKIKWTCRQCGHVLCVHNTHCVICAEDA